MPPRNNQKPAPSAHVSSPLKFNSTTSKPYSMSDRHLAPPSTTVCGRDSKHKRKSDHASEDTSSKHKHKGKKKKSHHRYVKSILFSNGQIYDLVLGR